ncbi:Gfo/Idh/MocA family oxidoreductase [Kribbella sp. NPDC050820]|uniref:Gfo/Idh/MocA family protein n=1 Tax=Kribbella sp. NPDC050820 TaxID=3155408 RepID=UPI0033FC9CCD
MTTPIPATTATVTTADAATPLRFAMIGAGVMARYHLPALAEQPGVGSVVALCDAREEAVKAGAELAPAARGFSTLDELLAEVEIDAAIIGTPHYLHFPQALELVRRGIHVLIEKPVTCTTTELRQLAAQSQKTGAFVLPGQTRRFVREMRWARAHIDADPGLIGEVTTFAIQSLQDLRAYPGGPGHWFFDGKLAGGGVVISLAVHQLDLLRYLTGQDFTQVAAAALYDPPFVNDAESSMSAMLQLDNGAAGTMQASYTAARAPFSESLNIIGRNGTLAQHAEKIGDSRGPLMIASSHGAAPTDWADQYSGWAQITPARGLEDWGANAFANMQAHFVDVIRGHVDAEVSLERNFNTIACIEALMRSAREQRPVEVEKW